MSKRKAKKPAAELPEVLELFGAIASFFPDATRFEGVVVRSVSMQFAKEVEFFSGTGAAKVGGRWNRVGLRATYASLDVVTATKEAYQMIRKFGFPMTAISPRVMAGAEVSLGKVLDVTDEAVLDAIGFSLADLIDEDWAVDSVGRRRVLDASDWTWKR